jgi:hypothetical protein
MLCNTHSPMSKAQWCTLPPLRNGGSYSTKLQPSQNKLCSLSMVFSFVHGEESVICPWTGMDNMVPWRAGDVWHWLVGVADSLWQSWVWATGIFVDSVHVTWVQYFVESTSVYSSVCKSMEGVRNGWWGWIILKYIICLYENRIMRRSKMVDSREKPWPPWFQKNSSELW